jgi:4-amino-4-deoxy-L-arabinose transferase-like glycosyltransferase
LAITRVLGALTAGALFGWLVPTLWATVTKSSPISVIRRLVFAGLGFLFWRDYFNFCLTDFLSLLLLGVAMLLLLRKPGVVAALLAGVTLGAVTNLRPVYLSIVPIVALLAFLPHTIQPWWLRNTRVLFLIMGLILSMVPQYYSNYYHTGIRSGLVLTSDPKQPNLFLQQLGWGLEMQKYETNVGGDYPLAQMRFEDHRGKELLANSGYGQFENFGQYVQLCLNKPWQMCGVFTRHLFNGLDLQYPTPYIQEVFVPTWPLALLNYSVIWGALLLAIALRPKSSWGEQISLLLVLLALLLPCLEVLPTAIECRFLLPLHLLFIALISFTAEPMVWWRKANYRIRIGLIASYLVVITAGFSASASAQSHLAITPRDILSDLPLHFPHSVDEQPW